MWQKIKRSVCTACNYKIRILDALIVMTALILIMVIWVHYNRPSQKTLDAKLLTADQQVEEAKDEADKWRKMMLNKHGLYLRTKKSLDEMRSTTDKLVRRSGMARNDILEAMRCNCNKACAKWAPNGKNEDCGNPLCPVCSSPSKDTSTSKKKK